MNEPGPPWSSIFEVSLKNTKLQSIDKDLCEVLLIDFVVVSWSQKETKCVSQAKIKGLRCTQSLSYHSSHIPELLFVLKMLFSLPAGLKLPVEVNHMEWFIYQVVWA